MQDDLEGFPWDIDGKGKKDLDKKCAVIPVL